METTEMKENLRAFYNREAEHRNHSEKQPWKIVQRDKFLQAIADEGKPRCWK